jgi:hypothetical protein
MKLLLRFDPVLAARLAFSAWIFLLSAATLFGVLVNGPVPGAPGWLVPGIAGVEAASALAFAAYPGGLALAGLCSGFSAASVLHVMLGQPIWRLPVYMLAAILLYWLQHRTHREVTRHGQIRSQ